MPTLVINVPSWKENESGAKSFRQICSDQVASGFAIWTRLIDRINPGCPVVLLCKDQRRRAEGKIARLIPTEKTGSGIQRYDVHIVDLRLVPYKPEDLNRNGVAV